MGIGLRDWASIQRITSSRLKKQTWTPRRRYWQVRAGRHCQAEGMRKKRERRNRKRRRRKRRIRRRRKKRERKRAHPPRRLPHRPPPRPPPRPRRLRAHQVGRAAKAKRITKRKERLGSIEQTPTFESRCRPSSNPLHAHIQ